MTKKPIDTNKYSENELLEWLDAWRDYCGESCIKGECIGDIEKCEPTYNQIVALIKKPEVTEEWIAYKAQELDSKIINRNLSFYCQCKDFIHSLVEEIKNG